MRLSPQEILAATRTAPALIRSITLSEAGRHRWPSLVDAGLFTRAHRLKFVSHIALDAAVWLRGLDHFAVEPLYRGFLNQLIAQHANHGSSGNSGLCGRQCGRFRHPNTQKRFERFRHFELPTKIIAPTITETQAGRE